MEIRIDEFRRMRFILVETDAGALLFPQEVIVTKAPLNKTRSARPFLKWAGGKSQLLPRLLPQVPRTYKKYYEPFAGGAALFFSLQPEKAELWDINPELVNCYQVLQRQPEELIEALKKHRYEKEYYYQIRTQDRAADFMQQPAVIRAARFLYLNKTCFNGLYRVNAAGHFNVPFGRYSNPKIVDEANLRACSAALQGTQIRHEHYSKIEEVAEAGDFVYFDPPYAPLSDTANFTTYSKDGFSEQDQRALAALCQRLSQRGVNFILSNSSSPLMVELYRDFPLQLVPVSRAINSKATARGKISEIVVTNLINA